MYSKEAQYYDKLYAYKDYRAEVQRFMPFIRQHLRSKGNRLLDVACGTGRHLEYLREDFEVAGLDFSPQLLQAAQERIPVASLYRADMLDFNLGREFDVVTCLFSSIAYVRTLENVRRAIGCMTRHLVSGGVLIIEPWLTPITWHPGAVYVSFVDEPQLKIVRMSTNGVDGRLSYFDFHYLVGTPQGTEHFVERHELGLFETEEMQQVLIDAGLTVSYDSEGITGRGLFIGQKP